jgi:hypothetical protein
MLVYASQRQVVENFNQELNDDVSIGTEESEEEADFEEDKPFTDGDLYRFYGHPSDVLICRRTGKAKRYGPIPLKDKMYWAVAQYLDFATLRFFPEFFSGDWVKYDDLTKSYINLKFKSAVTKIGNWYIKYKNLNHWKANIKSVNGEIRALAPNGVDYISSLEHFTGKDNVEN